MKEYSGMFLAMSFVWELAAHHFIVTLPFTKMEVGKIVDFTFFHPTLTDKYRIAEILVENDEDTKVRLEII